MLEFSPARDTTEVIGATNFDNSIILVPDAAPPRKPMIKRFPFFHENATPCAAAISLNMSN